MSEPATAFRRTLPSAARPLFKRLRRHVGDAQPGLAWHYRFGELIARLRTKVGAAGGANWLGRLADAVGYAPSSLLKYLKVAKTLTPGDVRELTGQDVPWTYVVHAVHLPDRTQMKGLLVRAAREGWTAGRVRGEAGRLGGGSRRRNAGRRPNEPRSFGPAVDLDRLAHGSRTWLHAYERLWVAPGGLALAGLKKPAARSDADRDRLQGALDAVRDLARAAAALKRELATLA